MADIMVRIKPETKGVLEKMKLTKGESYDEVIKRLILKIQNSIESHLKLDDKVAYTLQQRMEQIREGKVMSTDELFKKLYGKKKVK